MKRKTLFAISKEKAMNGFYKSRGDTDRYVFVRENAIVRNIRLKKLPKPPKLKDQLRSIDEAAIIEPYDKALFYFAHGGKVHPSAVREIFGRSAEGQRRKMISLIDKRGSTIDQLAHFLWEQMFGEYTTEDYKDAIERVLQAIISPSSAARELIEKYDYQTQFEKYAQRVG